MDTNTLSELKKTTPAAEFTISTKKQEFRPSSKKFVTFIKYQTRIIVKQIRLHYRCKFIVSKIKE